MVTTINPNFPNDFHPRVAAEAHEAALDLPVCVDRLLHQSGVLKTAQGFFEVKLSPDASPEDIEVLLYRAWKDPCCHSAFAEVVEKVSTA